MEILVGREGCPHEVLYYLQFISFEKDTRRERSQKGMLQCPAAGEPGLFSLTAVSIRNSLTSSMKTWLICHWPQMRWDTEGPEMTKLCP